MTIVDPLKFLVALVIFNIFLIGFCGVPIPQEYENKWERERIAKEVEKAEREAFLMEVRENRQKFCSKIDNPDADYQSKSIKGICGTR